VSDTQKQPWFREKVITVGSGILVGVVIAGLAGWLTLSPTLTEYRVRISRLEEQVKALSTPDPAAAARAVACVELGKRLAEASSIDAWNNSRNNPQVEKALQYVCASSRPATPP
jgi:hypothetical protein